MVVTVDGKVRDRIEVPANIDEETARSLAHEHGGSLTGATPPVD